MARIPDEAITSSGEISSTAFRLYAAYCMHRNRSTGGWNCPRSLILQDLPDLTEPSYFRVKKELISKGWIVATGNFVTPVKGFETIKNDSSDSEETIKNESKSDMVTIKNESETIKNDSPTLKDDSPRINDLLPVTLPVRKPIEAVFDFWCETFEKKSSAKFGSKRRNAVSSRLKEGYSVGELKEAILGCSVTPHNRGENDRGEEYVDLELICRNETQVERFRDNWRRQSGRPVETEHSRELCDRCRDTSGYVLSGNSNIRCDHRPEEGRRAGNMVSIGLGAGVQRMNLAASAGQLNEMVE